MLYARKLEIYNTAKLHLANTNSVQYLLQNLLVKRVALGI